MCLTMYLNGEVFMFWRLIDKLAAGYLAWRTRQDVIRRMVEQGIDKDLAILNLKKNLEKGSWEISATHPIVSFMALQMNEVLKERNAKNYVVWDLYPRVDLWKEGVKPVRVTIQLASGLNPGEKARILTNLLTTAEQGMSDEARHKFLAEAVRGNLLKPNATTSLDEDVWVKSPRFFD